MYGITSEIKYTKNNRILFLSSILIFLFFGINFSIEYATDTYATFMDNTVWEYMLYENGRIINAFIYWLFYQLSPAPQTVYCISFLCAVTFAIASVSLYGHILNLLLNNLYYSVFLSFFILLNPFSIEYFLYIEKGLFLFSLFCVICAVLCLNYYLDLRKTRFFFYTLICLWASIFCYQIIIGMFVICALPLLCKKSESWAELFRNSILTASLYALVLSSSYFVTTFGLHSSRIGHSHSILAVISDTLQHIISITKDSYYHLPNNYLLFCYLFLLLTCLFLSLYTNNPIKYFLLITYGFFIVILTSFFPFFCGVTSDYACRTVYPYGSIWGIILVIALQSSNISNNSDLNITWSLTKATTKNVILKHWIASFLIIVFLGIILTQYCLFQKVFLDRYKVNQTDKYICQMIGESIQIYENNSGKTITTICFYKDKSLTWGIDGAFQNGLLDRAHATGWSNLASINYYLDKQYIKGEPADYYTQYFQNKNWNFFSDEQLFFEENVLHFCVY